MGDSMTDSVETEPLDDSRRMPGWKIGVIILSIILGIVLLYKLFKRWQTKGLIITCCQQKPPSVHRRDTAHRELIRQGSGDSEDVVLDEGQTSQTIRGQPEPV